MHLQNTDRAAVKAYAATAGATATINQADHRLTTRRRRSRPSFSSRGPLRAGGGDLLKPDLIAPGQDILAGVAPPGNGGALFDLYSGTSMSSPHVAGLAALLKELHPDLVADGDQVGADDDRHRRPRRRPPAPNTNPLLIFRQGAGHVQPNSAADPGLVFDAGFNDWLASCAARERRRSFCPALDGRIDPSDLQRRLDRHRRPGGRADGDPQGHQRRQLGRDLHRVAHGHGRLHRRDQPGVAHARQGRDRHLHGHASPGPTAALNAYTGGQLTWTDGTHACASRWSCARWRCAAPAQVCGQLLRHLRLQRPVHGDGVAAWSRRRSRPAPSPTTRPTAAAR